MYNSEYIVREFFRDKEGAKGYADLEAQNGSGWKLPPTERKALAKRIYDEILADMIELKMIERTDNERE